MEQEKIGEVFRSSEARTVPQPKKISVISEEDKEYLEQLAIRKMVQDAQNEEEKEKKSKIFFRKVIIVIAGIFVLLNSWFVVDTILHRNKIESVARYTYEQTIYVYNLLYKNWVNNIPNSVVSEAEWQGKRIINSYIKKEFNVELLDGWEKRVETFKSISNQIVPQLINDARGMIKPMFVVDNYNFTSQFGTRMDPILKRKGFGPDLITGSFHTGVDIGLDIGTKIYAMADGVVIDAKEYGKYGRYLRLAHSPDASTNGILSVYAHLSKFLVSKGEKIKKGQVVALSGNSGKSTGPHLHWEIWISNQCYDPLQFVL